MKENLDEQAKESYHASLDASIESKFVQNREGSSLRTSLELSDVFVDDACALLGKARPQEDEFCGHGDECPEDCGQTNPDFASELCDDYQRELEAAGYTVIWKDGYVIYKDLTDEETEYVSNF